MIHELSARVVKNRPLTPRVYELVLELPPGSLRGVKPGQFLMLKPSPTFDPLGRRAFAFADLTESRAVVFYEVRGRGTKLLTRVKEGERLSVLLPLGKRVFPLEGERHLLLGGGIGLAGLTLLAKELFKRGKELLVAYGARSKEELALLSFLERLGVPFEVYTEDGSYGKRGLVTEALKRFKGWTVHACGPKGMLRAVKEATKGEAYLSLEERMACGYGVCLGCAVKTAGGYGRVCYEGPVFKAGEVEL
ncbi:MAG: dihydroorotate dehydrogenase electron transfer subunit [Aquificae bacterium]|nr:dihydroorotate dehydrogenase electron transfer subunit [Aquificota bacterium]